MILHHSNGALYGAKRGQNLLLSLSIPGVINHGGFGLERSRSRSRSWSCAPLINHARSHDSWSWYVIRDWWSKHDLAMIKTWLSHDQNMIKPWSIHDLAMINTWLANIFFKEPQWLDGVLVLLDVLVLIHELLQWSVDLSNAHFVRERVIQPVPQLHGTKEKLD